MKKMLTWILSAMILSTACMLSAQDAPQNFRNRRPQNRISPQERKKQWESVQKQLKQKYPEKYQEIMKLAESNFQEAQEKLVQLAKTAKLELPTERRFSPRGNFRRPQGPNGMMPGRTNRPQGSFTRSNPRTEALEKIKAAYPAEFAQIEKMQADVETKLQELAKKANITLPDTPEVMMKKMQAVREKYKKEFEEIQQLWRTDPVLAREKMKDIFAKEGINMPQFSGNRPPQAVQKDPPRRRNDSPFEKIRQARKKYPEEMKKIEAYRETDRAKYQTELRALIKRMEQEQKTSK